MNSSVDLVNLQVQSNLFTIILSEPTLCGREVQTAYLEVLSHIFFKELHYHNIVDALICDRATRSVPFVLSPNSYSYFRGFYR